MYFIQCLQKGGLFYGRTRKIKIPSGIHSPVSRMCDRNRKRMEISIHCRTGRRRCLCAVLSVVSDYSRTPDHDDGICGWACQPEKSGQSLPGTGKTRTEMAYPRDYHIDRLLSSYDVLYNGHRLDASLFLYDGHRTVSGTGCRRCIRTVYHNAEQTSDHGLLDGGSCLRRRTVYRHLGNHLLTR